MWRRVVKQAENLKGYEPKIEISDSNALLFSHPHPLQKYNASHL